MKPLHILEFYNDTGPGGAEQMIIDLSRGLAAAGHRVTVGLLKAGWLSERLEPIDSVRTVVLPKRSRFDLATMRGFARLIREDAVDVIHSHEFGANISGTLLARWTGRAGVATVHGREYVAERRRRQRLAWRDRAPDRPAP